MVIEAPHPGHEVLVVIPEPERGNTEFDLDSVVTHQMMDGSIRSYLKSTDWKLMSYSFSLTQHKAYEIRNFLIEYLAQRWRITDHNNDRFVGYCVTNPIDFIADRRGDLAIGDIGEEVVTLQFSFEGVKQQ